MRLQDLPYAPPRGMVASVEQGVLDSHGEHAEKEVRFHTVLQLMEG